VTQEITVQQTSSTIRFLWTEDRIEITVNRIRAHRDGRTTAEIVIRALGLQHPHLHGPVQVNLVTGKWRKDLAKDLAERHEAAWENIFEYLCYHTLERIRTGEPIEELSTAEELSPPEHLLYPILPKNQPTVLFGLGGVGKSQLAVALAMCAMLPWEDNPLRLAAPPTSVNALYLDWETDRRDILWHMKAIRAGAGLEFNLFLNYRRCSAPLVDDAERIQEAVMENNIGFVIVDSVAAACGADLNAPEVVTKLFTALRSLKVTSLLLAHTAKNVAGKDSTPFGSAFFVNYARSVWEMKKSQEQGEDGLSVGLFHRKVNMGKLHKPRGLSLSYADGATRIRTKDVKDIVEFRDHLGQGDKIEVALRDGRMTRSQLVEATGLSDDVVRNVTNRLEKKGNIVRMGDFWGLCAGTSTGTASGGK